jgi:hypothetical protein
MMRQKTTRAYGQFHSLHNVNNSRSHAAWSSFCDLPTAFTHHATARYTVFYFLHKTQPPTAIITTTAMLNRTLTTLTRILVLGGDSGGGRHRRLLIVLHETLVILAEEANGDPHPHGSVITAGLLLFRVRSGEVRALRKTLRQVV